MRDGDTAMMESPRRTCPKEGKSNNIHRYCYELSSARGGAIGRVAGRAAADCGNAALRVNRQFFSERSALEEFHVRAGLHALSDR